MKTINSFIIEKLIINKNTKINNKEKFHPQDKKELKELVNKLIEERGIEAKSNTAPMQRFVWTNNFGIFTKGITQYEVFKDMISIPLLRATGVISNPHNSSRSTPAGPPLETPDLQMLRKNIAEFYIYNGDIDGYNRNLDKVFSEIIF